jgi:hypothetical protein
MRIVISVAVFILLGGAVLEAEAGNLIIEGNKIDGVRDARYCEIIPIVRDGLHLKATVYNTLGLNDCPPAIWNAITEDAMKQRFDALTVLLNGPRFFIMDSIAASGATKAGETIEAGGLKLTERATIDLGCSICCIGRFASRPSTVTRFIRSRRDGRCSCSRRPTVAAMSCRPMRRSSTRA